MSKMKTANDIIGEAIAEKRNANILHVTEKKKKNYEMLKASPEFFPSAIYCLSLGCNRKFRVETVGEGLRLLESNKCFCKDCQPNGRSKMLNRFIDSFPQSFSFGENQTDITKLPKCFAEITEWAKNHLWSGGLMRSLYIYGDSGVCKSRMLAKIASSALLYGVEFICLRGGEFASKMREFSLKENKVDEMEFLNELKDVQLLFLDDFGRDVLSETMNEKLWNVIDSRMGNKSTIFSSNFNTIQLNLEQSAIRRIADYSDILLVKK